MSRVPVLVAASLVALALPLSSARADVLHDVARRTYRLGVAALDAVDATPAQRRAVSDAAHDLADRLAPHEAEVRDWVRSAHRTFVADTVERTEVEAVRVEGVQLVDDLSAETVDFVVDVADTLTAEQRRELVRLARDRAKRLVRP